MKSRQKEVLTSVIDNFIESGIPISSKMLLDRSSINLSSASIRQIFSKLEFNGFLKKIHTSSGRVPTDMGYRIFVDSVCPSGALISLEKYIDQKNVIKKFCELFDVMLTNMSEYMPYVLMAIFTVTPNVEHLKFFKINSYYGLLILYHRSGLVSETYIEFEHDISDSNTDDLMDWLNERLNLMSETQLNAERDSFSDDDFQFLKMVLDKILNFKMENNKYTHTSVKNISNCFKLPDFTSKISMQNLLDVIDDKQTIIRLLSSVLKKDEVNVLIGSEMNDERLEEFSLVGVPIKLDNDQIGCLGVFGPSRMDYLSVINLVTSPKRLAELIRI